MSSSKMYWVETLAGGEKRGSANGPNTFAEFDAPRFVTTTTNKSGEEVVVILDASTGGVHQTQDIRAYNSKDSTRLLCTGQLRLV